MSITRHTCKNWHCESVNNTSTPSNWIDLNGFWFLNRGTSFEIQSIFSQTAIFYSEQCQMCALLFWIPDQIGLNLISISRNDIQTGGNEEPKINRVKKERIREHDFVSTFDSVWQKMHTLPVYYKKICVMVLCCFVWLVLDTHTYFLHQPLL